MPMGLPLLLGLAAFGGCAANGAAPGLAFGRTAEPTPVAAPAAAATAPSPSAGVGNPEVGAVGTVAATANKTDSAVPVVAAEAPVVAAADVALAPASEAGADPERSHERRLRHDLAQAADPVPAAIELVAWLASEERHAEALAVVDLATARRATDELRVLRVGVLRDLGRRHEAVAELRALRRDVSADRLNPSLLFELAELEWLEGDGPAAAATLRSLAEVHAGDAFVIANADNRKRLATEIAAGGRPSRMRVRDVLGNLRGAPEAPDRLAALAYLATPAVRELDGGGAALAQAVAIGLGDDAEVVRAKAMELADPDPDVRTELVVAAFADPSTLVRQKAVARLFEWQPVGAAALALQQLEREDDVATFFVLGCALARWTATEPPTRAQVSAPAGRQELVQSLRRRIQS